jgi:serine/threonine protein kinase
MVDRIGQQLGNYRLLRLLGKGGFAEVYLGEHLRLGTRAAIKVLYTRLADPSEVEGFEKEARTIAHLKHPHIVRVFDYDVERLQRGYKSGIESDEPGCRASKRQHHHTVCEPSENR